MYQPCGPSDFSKVQGCKPDRGVGGQEKERNSFKCPNVETEPTNHSLLLHYHCFHHQIFISAKNKGTDSALDVLD